MSFKPNERDVVRVPKLNSLTNRVATLEEGGTGSAGELAISVTELPYAEPGVPLVRWRLTGGLDFSSGVADAELAAMSVTVLPILKDGVANGSITFTATTGVVSFTNSIYPPGSLFEIYPPATPDPTLDILSITLTAT